MKDIPLGKTQSYEQEYSPDILFAIPRKQNRIHLAHAQFNGYDLWNAYEFSWLNERAFPQSQVLRIKVSCNSENIVESKSLKLYLNTFSFKQFESQQALLKILSTDLAQCVKGDVELELIVLDSNKLQIVQNINDSVLLDGTKLSQSPDFSEVKAGLLQPKNKKSTSTVLKVHSHLFRSVCPVTSQPDWASVFICYQGREICNESLLSYLLSFRKHAGFHEDCVERIYSDIFTYCKPEKLSVYAAFTRRGGIDINPFRSNFEKEFPALRASRQ